jgi:hypothetical protein
VDSCSHCGGPLPANATFCPSCGRRADAPPVSEREVPIDVQHAEPRYFGLGPPVFVFSAAIGLLVLGIVLIAIGIFAPGVIAVILALCLLPSFLAGARRWPDTPIARAGLSTADRVRDEAGVAVDSISAWSRAGREVARLRKEQFRLRRERDSKIRELGVSFYAEDGRADELKALAKELDAQIDANDAHLRRTIASTRRRMRKGRAAVVATEVIKPVEPTAEVAAPEPAPAPEPESEPEAKAADEPLSRAQSEPEQAPKRPARKRQTRSR